MQNLLRKIPSVTELLEHPQLKQLVDKASHHTVVTGTRTILQDLRSQLQAAATDAKIPQPSEIVERIADWISTSETPHLRPVINATGVLLHTGLGRAPLAGEAVEAINEIAAGYCSVELDLESGKRSKRVLAVQKSLCELTGAEAAAVVNNNAAATLLTLTALAQGREVVVSRGQLVEIGGSFRLPDVMTSCGVSLKEVGTTNKTRIADYAAAVNENTAALMRVHTSNYLVVGFTESASLLELIELGRKQKIPVIDDIGSGALVDLSEYGLVDEPLAVDSIRGGADVVLMSGDKLLGGPQCGIIIGKRKFVQRIQSHPLMRAMRVDKITLAALAATLLLYRDPQKAFQQIPLLAMLNAPLDGLENRARRLAPQIEALPWIEQVEVVSDESTLGGGSVPTQQIPTWCLELVPSNQTLDQVAARLRKGEPAVVGRVQRERLILDLRTVPPKHDLDLMSALESVCQSE